MSDLTMLPEIESTNAPQLVTFGCRLNTYESEVMRSHAQAAGLKNAIIVNTCAVTGEAERQARQAIRKLRREHPQAQIIVTGCAAQIHPDSFAAMPEVSRVLGNDDKMKPESWGLNPDTERVKVNDIMSVQETASHLVSGFEGKARAFVQVQNGCDHRCTFCIIPFGRGNSRSVPMGEIVQQVRLLADSGYNEVVLTGVDISSYGSDLPGTPTLGQMIRRLLALVPQLKRLRLSSIDSVEIDDDLWRLIADEPRLMPHLHLSLQAGDDLILKRMKRRHLRQQAIDVCQKARQLRPDIVFGADIIAGFPTETEEMFQNTLRLIEDCDLTWLHVFPYSARPGTPAGRMPQVPMEQRKERATRLRKAGEDAVQKHLEASVGKTVSILVEKEYTGRTEHFAEVLLDAPLKPGDLARVSLGAIEGSRLKGKVLPC